MRRCCPLILSTLLPLMLGACTQFPALDHTRSDAIDRADYPVLVQLAPLLAQAAVPGDDPVATEDVLRRRLAALRARADTMRGSVLTGAEKKRLEQGLR